MWLCAGKLKVKTAHFRLTSASQKRACLSSLKTCDSVNISRSIVRHIRLKESYIWTIFVPVLTIFCLLVSSFQDFSVRFQLALQIMSNCTSNHLFSFGEWAMIKLPRASASNEAPCKTFDMDGFAWRLVLQLTGAHAR